MSPTVSISLLCLVTVPVKPGQNLILGAGVQTTGNLCLLQTNKLDNKDLVEKFYLWNYLCFPLSLNFNFLFTNNQFKLKDLERK